MFSLLWLALLVALPYTLGELANAAAGLYTANACAAPRLQWTLRQPPPFVREKIEDISPNGRVVSPRPQPHLARGCAALRGRRRRRQG